MKNIRLAIGILALAPVAVQAQQQGFLENPYGDIPVSGIVAISGWHCTARRIEIQIDGHPLVAGANTERLDIAPLCGKPDTGFSVLFNWGIFPSGVHTVRALADGVEFATRRVTVVNLGGEFITGRTGSTTIHDFPSVGKSAVLEWQQGLQSFVVREVKGDAPSLAGRWNGANLEVRSGCRNPDANGNHGTYHQSMIRFDLDRLVIEEATTSASALTCTYVGPYIQQGTMRAASGTLTCSDGKQGRFTTKDILVTPNEMSLRLAIQLDTTETCAIDAVLGGSRLF